MKPEQLKALAAYFAKRAESLGKSHSFHTAMAAHHGEMEAHHTAHAALHKATADGMDDDHEMKQHCTKAAGHHEAMAKCHGAMCKAHTEHAANFKAETDTMKAFGTDFEKAAPATPAAAPAAPKETTMKPEEIKKCAAALGISEEEFSKKYTVATAAAAATPSGEGAISDMVKEATAALTKSAIESFQTDDTVKNTVRDMVLKQVADALSGQIIPDGARGTIPSNVPNRAVTRPGQPGLVDKTNVPVEFEGFLKIEE